MSETRSGFIFDSDSVSKLIGPIVYIVHEGDRPIYIGMSSIGIGRVFRADHKIWSKGIGCVGRIQIIYCDTASDARILEYQLIKRYVPKFNDDLAVKKQKLDSKDEKRLNEALQKKRATDIKREKRERWRTIAKAERIARDILGR